LSIPYGGIKGTIRDVAVLPPASSGFPALVDSDSTVITQSSKIVTFSLGDNDQPTVNYRLLFPSRRVYIDVIDNNSRSLGIINGGDNHWVGQNDDSADNKISTQAWDGPYLTGGSSSSGGTTSNTSNAPDGTYQLRLHALNPFGDENNDDDYETWTSVPFIINRSSSLKKGGKKNIDSIRGPTLKQLLDKALAPSASARAKAKVLAEHSMLPRPVNIKSAKK
jgi:hypothetical protein